MRAAAFLGVLLVAALTVQAPALAGPRRDHDRTERRFDPVRERAFERRIERYRDDEDRRDRREASRSKGAFEADGSRRKFYDKQETPDP